MRYAEAIAPRDHDPVIILRRGTDDRYGILDGNGRVIGAALKNAGSIDAYYGHVIDPARNLFIDHWVPTSTMMELVYEHREHLDNTASYASVLETMVRNSEVGRIELRHRAIDLKNRDDVSLLRAIAELMPSHSAFLLDGLT